jgi:transaldolase
VDTEVDRRLGEAATYGSGKDFGMEVARLRRQAAIANSHLAYELYIQTLASPRWQTLAAAGAWPQRLVWASTGVKDKAFEDTRYVVELVAPDTVNTMPEATLQAVADHGKVRGDTIQGGYAAARSVLNGLHRIGVDMADVASTLEAQGIASFTKSWDELIASVTARLEKAGASVMPAGAVTPAESNGSPATGAPRASAGVARR